MSRLALTPTNTPASATALSIPTLRIGDLYYNTTVNGLMSWNGTAWVFAGSLNAIDGGAPNTVSWGYVVDGGTP